MKSTQTEAKEMSSEQIDTLELLRAYLYYKFKDSIDYAEMFDVFVSGKSKDRFWIYELGYEDSDKKEMVIDYSLNGGGGWLNIYMELDEFNRCVQAMLNWSITDDLKALITNELTVVNDMAQANKP